MATRESKNQYMREWYAANRERQRNYGIAYRARVREERNAKRREQYQNDAAFRSEILAKVKDYRARNPDAKRKTNLKCYYGMTMEQYDAMVASQGGGCAICGRTESGGRNKRLHVDHDHASGMVRGILCSSCNLAIGKFGDNPESLRRAADYLESARIKESFDASL